MPSQSTLTGAAGEHYVMCELLRHNFIAALAPAGVPNTDIVVTDLKGSRLCSIQVKTRSGLGNDGGWHMRAKHEGIREERSFYCFVDFHNSYEVLPDVFVIPSVIVADAIFAAHRKWLSTPGKRGQQRKDSVMRRLLPDYSKTFAEDNPYPVGWLTRYRNSWHLLKLDPQPLAAGDETETETEDDET